MFKQILSIIILSTIIFSCNQKKETKYSKIELTDNFTIEIPSDYFSYGNSEERKIWKSGETSFLLIETKYANSTDLNKEIQEYSSAQDSKDLYKNKRLVKTENFENDDLKGIISFYKNDVKGKGAGLVTLTSYITFAIVQSNDTQFNIESMTLSDNTFDEITKSIKSISSKTNSIKIPVANLFDKNKALEEGYQVFQEDGFMVKCKGELKLDKLRIQQMKQAGMADISKPYHVYHNDIDYNINVSSFDQVLFGKNDKEIEEKFIERSIIAYSWLMHLQYDISDSVPKQAIGGFRRSLHQSEIRIDNTQHAISAMCRGIKYIYKSEN